MAADPTPAAPKPTPPRTPRPETPPEEYVRLARQQRFDGHPELALAILEVARRMAPVDASIFFEIGQAHAAAHRIDEALAMFEAAIAKDPDFLDAHWEKGVLLERRGLIDEAMAAWRLSDLTRDAIHHSLYVVAALKSSRSTNESLLAAQLAWAQRHLPA